MLRRFWCLALAGLVACSWSTRARCAESDSVEAAFLQACEGAVVEAGDKLDGILSRIETAAQPRRYRLRTDPLGRTQNADLDHPIASLYADLAALRLSAGRAEDAWDAVERGHCRLLWKLQLLSNRSAMTQSEWLREMRLRQLASGVANRLEVLTRAAEIPPEGVDLDALRGELRAAEQGLAAFQHSMTWKYGAASTFRRDLAGVQATLPAGAALIGWLHSESRCVAQPSVSWVYVVRSSGGVHWHRIEADSLPDRDIERLREIVSHPPGFFGMTTEVRALARRVYTRWLAPAETVLQGAHDLVIVPSDPFLAFPLEILEDASAVELSRRFRIRYCPSGAVQAFLAQDAAVQHDSRRERALFVADPPFDAEQARLMNALPARGGESVSFPVQSGMPTLGVPRLARGTGNSAFARLPGSRIEVLQASARLGKSARLLLGPDARETALVSLAGAMREYRILHFATHAVVDDEDVNRCALILSQVDLADARVAAQLGERVFDGRWTAREILDEWQLDADLVVLSGCETFLGKTVPGEGYVGLSQAFLQAGARNLVLSLWEVSDASTAMLMESFYRHLFPDPAQDIGPITSDRIASALAIAREEVRTYSPDGKQQPYRHPWYWAGFVHLGACPNSQSGLR